MPRIEVKVKPQARDSRLTPPAEGETLWHAQLKSPPVDGKANAELIALVAKHFGCRKADVSIKLGGASRTKWVDVKD
jgi:uncharacterized protein (TIGR00251 family)